MKNRDLVWISASVLALWVFFAAFDVFAGPCKCAFGSPGTPANGLKDMDAVFVGKVTAIEEAEDAPGFFDVTFQANKYYKGSGDTNVCVRTSKSAKDCGYNFMNGEAYLVYSKYLDGVLFTDVCSRTRTIQKANAEGDIATLDMIVYAGKTEAETEQMVHLDPRLQDVLKADAVFLGEVLSIEPSKVFPGLLDVKFSVRTSFSVGKCLDPEMIIRTPQDAGHKGFDFTTSKDKRYLVYAYNRNGVLYTDRQTRTKELQKAALNGDLEYLLNSLVYGMSAYGKDGSELSPANRTGRDKLPCADVLWDAVKKIVLSYYPAAQFVVKQDHLMFEYKTRDIVLGDVTSVGYAPGIKIIKGPQEEGVFGEITLVYDPYYDYYINTGWSNYRSHHGARMFPEQQIEIAVKEKGSKKYSCYVYSTLILPLDAQKKIKGDIEKLIDEFESCLK